MSNSNSTDYATGSFPESLIPDRPSEIAATFVSFNVGTTREGKDVPIAVLEVDGEGRSLWLHSKALRSQFRKLDPRQGEKVTVTFAATKTLGANGREYWADRASAPDRPVEKVSVEHPLFKDEEADDHGTPITY